MSIFTGSVNRLAYLVLSKLVPRGAAVRCFSRTARGVYGASR